MEHMKACNPRGPLVVYVCKLFPKADCSKFDAFGRVMSGTVKPGDKARRRHAPARSGGAAPLAGGASVHRPQCRRIISRHCFSSCAPHPAHVSPPNRTITTTPTRISCLPPRFAGPHSW